MLLTALGCGDDGATATAPGAPDTATAADVSAGPATCAELAPTCKKRQQGCAMTADGPACHQCEEGNHPAGDEASCAPIAGDKLSHDFGVISMQPGDELNGVCQSWVLNNPEPLWVSAVELLTAEGAYHHSNWFFVPEGSKDYPDGTWMDCYNSGFSELDAALTGGVLYAQSTQVRHDVQLFPEGVAVRIPAYARVIGATHLLNVSGQDVDASLRMNIYTVPESEVTVKLTPFRLSYLDLDIPPQSIAEFGATCDLEKASQNVLKEPLSMKLYYAMPHYHGLGWDFSLSIVGGPRDGEQLIELGAYGSDPFGRVFDPPVDLTGATGLRFSCTFKNPREDQVGWGIGDQEMCVMLGFTDSQMAFDASVGTNEVGGTIEGTVMNSGACKVLGFPFSHDIPPGQPTE